MELSLTLLGLPTRFRPVHIVRDRDKSGTPVLAAPPLSLTFDDLERFLGLSIDEAVSTMPIACTCNWFAGLRPRYVLC